MIDKAGVPLALTVLAIMAFVLWKGPQWQLRRAHDLSTKERFDRVNEARKTLATILGGILLLLGFFGTWENIRVAQEGQITERFTKAIDQLGAVDSGGEPNVSIRVGGIYALQRIATDSQRDHWPIIQILCSYVRTSAPVHTLQRIPSADVQAALTVLGVLNRTSPREEQLDLSRTNLRGADLTKGNFSTAFLNGADLRGAFLSNSDFDGAYLEGIEIDGADLRGTDLTGTQGLTQQQIDGAIGDTKTKLPAALQVPDSWRK